VDDATRNAVDRLLELVPPPRRRASDGDWSQTEAELGVPLPRDFVELATAWGDGMLVDHVSFAPADRFAARAERWVAWERESWEAMGEPAPSLWPDLGGLLPWADTSNGDRLWWTTGGPSDTWTVATQEARSFDIEETEWTCAELLLAFLEGRTELLGGFDTSVEPWFKPTRDQFHLELAAPAGLDLPAEPELVATVAEVLPVRARRERWSDGRSFQCHWVTGEDDWDVSAETRGLRLTVPLEQEKEARDAAAEVARRPRRLHVDGVVGLPDPP
jgi:hypothetical protein